MNYSFFDLMALIGSLGLFLYGMKIMSEGLQKMAGSSMRSILGAMTKNRVAGVLTGFSITALIQSSSATTVMVVSFVNAGLLGLTQAISVIMGANIGTTITAWIISLLGFKISIATLSIPLVAVAVPFVFSSKGKRKSIGEFIIGFALLFMGLDLLKDAVPDLQANPGMLEFLSAYTDLGFGSVLIFLSVGTLLTIVVQSSSATMAITLIMCAKGWLPFELGAAMVLGENIGTTITANIAAIPANVSAKRAALAHFIFNVFGVVWMLSLFYPVVNLVSDVVSNIGPGNPEQLVAFSSSIAPETLTLISSPDANALTEEQSWLRMQLEDYRVATSYALSLFHTFFNVLNTFVMIWFVKSIARIVSYLIPQKEVDEEFQLKYISRGLLSASELSLLQVRKEIIVYVERTERMFGMVRELCAEKNDNQFVKTFSRIEKYEGISDRMEIEIADYLTKVADGRLSNKSKQELQSMFRIVSEIESIGDSCHNMARTLMRKKNDGVVYTPQMEGNIILMMNLAEEALRTMKQQLQVSYEAACVDCSRSGDLENEINNFRDLLRLQNINDVKEQKYDYQASITYMDIIGECEKMGDYIINVVQALNEIEC